MSSAKTMVTALALSLMLLVACTPKVAAPAPAPVPQAPAPAKPAAPAPAPEAVTKAPAKEAWEVEWDKTLEAAKKEGMVMLTTSAGPEVRNALREGFEKAYGITLESVSRRAVEFLAKVLVERRTGLYFWDTNPSGASFAINSLKGSGLLDPLEPLLILPDLTDPELIKKTWYGGELRWVDRDHTVLMGLCLPNSPIAINTDLVKESEIKSYQDLLDPKWKGKIMINDPTVSGTSNADFMPMIVLGGVAGGVEWLRALVKNEPVVMRDERLIIDWLAHGKVAIVVAPKPDIIVEYMRAGAHVTVVTPKEGTVLTGVNSGITAINKRPHPNATKVFINWYLSKEGQTALSRSLGGQSARLDVPTDFLPPQRTRQEGVNYPYVKEREEYILKQTEVDKIVKEIFAPLLK